MKEETYRVTPLGLLGQKAYDEILLFMVKNGENAIIWDGKDLLWGKVEWRKHAKKVAKSRKNK